MYENQLLKNKKDVLYYIERIREEINDFAKHTEQTLIVLSALHDCVPDSVLKALINELKSFVWTFEDKLENISDYLEIIIEELKKRENNELHK